MILKNEEAKRYERSYDQMWHGAKFDPVSGSAPHHRDSNNPFHWCSRTPEGAVWSLSRRYIGEDIDFYRAVSMSRRLAVER